MVRSSFLKKYILEIVCVVVLSFYMFICVINFKQKLIDYLNDFISTTSYALTIYVLNVSIIC